MSHRDPPTVVVVDDDASILFTASRALRKLPIAVCPTNNGHEALEWLATREVAVIVTDYEMPKMNGVELTEAARRTQPSTVRVLMTGRQALETAVDAINRGEIFRFIQKPFDSEKLRNTVTDAVARNQELVKIAANHDQILRRHRHYEQLEREYPGIRSAMRDEAGRYFVPEVCNADALRLLRLDK